MFSVVVVLDGKWLSLVLSQLSQLNCIPGPILPMVCDHLLYVKNKEVFIKL